jgi:hypothetical protein
LFLYLLLSALHHPFLNPTIQINKQLTAPDPKSGYYFESLVEKERRGVTADDLKTCSAV